MSLLDPLEFMLSVSQPILGSTSMVTWSQMFHSSNYPSILFILANSLVMHPRVSKQPEDVIHATKYSSSRLACRLSLFLLSPFPAPHLISAPSLCAGGPVQPTYHPLHLGCAMPHFTSALFYMKLEAQQDQCMRSPIVLFLHDNP